MKRMIDDNVLSVNESGELEINTCVDWVKSNKHITYTKSVSYYKLITDIDIFISKPITRGDKAGIGSDSCVFYGYAIGSGTNGAYSPANGLCYGTVVYETDNTTIKVLEVYCLNVINKYYSGEKIYVYNLKYDAVNNITTDLTSKSLYKHNLWLSISGTYTTPGGSEEVAFKGMIDLFNDSSTKLTTFNTIGNYLATGVLKIGDDTSNTITGVSVSYSSSGTRQYMVYYVSSSGSSSGNIQINNPSISIISDYVDILINQTLTIDRI